MAYWHTTNNYTYLYTTSSSWTTSSTSTSPYITGTYPYYYNTVSVTAKEKKIDVSENDVLDLLQGDEKDAI